MTVSSSSIKAQSFDGIVSSSRSMKVPSFPEVSHCANQPLCCNQLVGKIVSSQSTIIRVLSGCLHRMLDVATDILEDCFAKALLAKLLAVWTSLDSSSTF